MRTRDSNSRLSTYAYGETIYDFSALTSVSTTTVLLAYTDFASDYTSLCFIVENNDAVENVNVTIQRSGRGTYPDSGLYAPQTLVAAAQNEAILEVGPDILTTYWRLTAATDSPSFPTVSVRWAVFGRRR